MVLLHDKFSKGARLIGVSCACGLVILHDAVRSVAICCPNCGAEEDLTRLIDELLLNRDLDTLLADVDKKIEALLEE